MKGILRGILLFLGVEEMCHRECIHRMRGGMGEGLKGEYRIYCVIENTKHVNDSLKVSSMRSSALNALHVFL